MKTLFLSLLSVVILSFSLILKAEVSEPENPEVVYTITQQMCNLSAKNPDHCLLIDDLKIPRLSLDKKLNTLYLIKRIPNNPKPKVIALTASTDDELIQAIELLNISTSSCPTTIKINKNDHEILESSNACHK